MCLLEEEDVRAGRGHKVGKVKYVATDALDIEGSERERAVGEVYEEP
jgi:hypothetical protein